MACRTSPQDVSWMALPLCAHFCPTAQKRPSSASKKRVWKRIITTCSRLFAEAGTTKNAAKYRQRYNRKVSYFWSRLTEPSGSHWTATCTAMPRRQFPWKKIFLKPTKSRTTSLICYGRRRFGRHRTQPNGTISSSGKGSWCSNISPEHYSFLSGNTMMLRRCNCSTCLPTASTIAHTSRLSPICCCSESATRNWQP